MSYIAVIATPSQLEARGYTRLPPVLPMMFADKGGLEVLVPMTPGTYAEHKARTKLYLRHEANAADLKLDTLALGRDLYGLWVPAWLNSLWGSRSASGIAVCGVLHDSHIVTSAIAVAQGSANKVKTGEQMLSIFRLGGFVALSYFIKNKTIANRKRAAKRKGKARV